ncbi:MAG: helix-turn-helix transcriptional regulator [Parvularculaceae bacterium]
MSLAARNYQTDLTKKDRLNNEEAAQYLGLKAATLNKWRVYGEGPPFIKVGRLVRYRRTDLDAYLSNRLVSSTSELSAR